MKRVGRGPGSGRGKTSCRGKEGQKARSSSHGRQGNEGGQMKLFRKLPHRGFTRGGFIKEMGEVNLMMIEKLYQDGEVVNLATLKEKGIVPSRIREGFKVLGKGECNKKVTIEAHAFSASAKKKLEAKKIPYKELQK